MKARLGRWGGSDICFLGGFFVTCLNDVGIYFGKGLLIASERCVRVSEVLYHDLEGMCIEIP